MKKSVKRTIENHYLLVKEQIQHDITIVDMYASNMEQPKYMNQTLIDVNGETDAKYNDITALLLSTFINSQDTRQKVNKDTLELNPTLEQQN